MKKPTTFINLNLGSGVCIRRGFINVDKYYSEEEIRSKKGRFKMAVVEKGGTYVQADIKKMPFPDNYADYVELFNTIEHFPHYHVLEYMKEIYRVMKKDGMLRIMTNSFSGICAQWLQLMTDTNLNIDQYNDMAEVFYGNQYGDSEGEVHRCPFTPQYMNYILTNTGFKKGTMTVIKVGSQIPDFGSHKMPKGVVARNDLLFVEAIK